MKNKTIKTLALLGMLTLPLHVCATSLTSLSDDIVQKATASLLVQLPNTLINRAAVKGVKSIRANAFMQQCTSKPKHNPDESVTLTLFYLNQQVARAMYKSESKQNRTFLTDFKVDRAYRDKGLGGKFFTHVMAEIAKSKLPQVAWLSYPTDIPTGIMSFEEAREKVHTFYRAQGAIITEIGYAFLDLVKAGYLKPEEVKHAK